MEISDKNIRDVLKSEAFDLYYQKAKFIVKKMEE